MRGSTGVAIGRSTAHEGRIATRTPPARRAGVELRTLPRIHGETAQDACKRAAAMGLTWWPYRINRGDPWADVRNWIWHFDPAIVPRGRK